MQLYILRVGCTELTSHNYQLSIQEFIMGGGGGGGGAGAHSAWGESSVWFMPCRAATALCGWTKGSVIRPYRKQKKSIAACCAMASLK